MEYKTAFLTIATQDLETLVNFYKTLLENNPEPYLPNKYAEFQLAGGLKLGIFQPKDTHKNEFSQPEKSAMSLCIEVGDLDSAIAQLSALGDSPSGEVTTASHGKEIYAYDPDGNRLILHCST
ncbi:Glyoxalase/bleomycin resistance protein/dioxygenase [Halothece sp. PCC 7418]|uniref:VOC family protein n=1 Tax=Halothece sp. (strain PCC 7418) TaxID=65093 RepID=UPI0002A076EB|nr:VOC family protein [Halothece sp. PCC 7418]AFZ45934.1 Glyoxalase/bleomycin resistance protein/dioxygenase [Halothece sp. PCC 7418]